MLAAGLTGYSELSALGHRLREAKNVELKKELRQALRQGMRPLATKIRAGSPTYTPAGYEATFARSLRFSTRVNDRGTKAAVDFVVTAKGKTEPRQIREINAGRLKHPVHGRYRRTKRGRIRNPWRWQVIKPGFFDEPVRENYDEMRQAAREAIHRVAEKITKG